jgi:sec-independent protein translocase protein TatA
MPSWIGPWEIAIVLVLILVIFGPRKLPELGSSLGKSIRGFKKGMKEGEQEASSSVAETHETAEHNEEGPVKAEAQQGGSEPAKSDTTATTE